MATNFETPTMMRVLAAAVNSGTPTLIWGDPGAGKTAKIEAYAAAWGREVRTIAASSREPQDFMGLPMEDGGRVVYSPLSWALDLNAAPKSLLVIDELSTGSSGTFKAFLRIVQERFVGELKLHDGVSVVAIANPPEIAVDGMDLPAPVSNRFLHLDWYFDADQWFAGVGTNFEHDLTPDPASYLGEATPERRAAVAAMVTGFLHTQPKLINQVPTDYAQQGKAWPSARAWTNLIDVLSWIREDDDDARDMAIKGLVGEGAFREFVAWVANADLPHPEDVIADPTIVRFDDRVDRTFAVLSAVTDLALMRGDRDTWEGALKVMVAAAHAHRADVAMTGTRRLLNVREHVQDGVPAGVREAFTDLLVAMGRLSTDTSDTTTVKKVAA